MTHFLDDFLIMEPPSHDNGGDPSQAGMTSLKSMLLTFKQLQVPISPSKTQGPLTRLEFLGIVLDSEKMEACLPQDKVHHLQEELDKWQRRKSATLKELQSLIGTLNFVCRVVPPGRPFLQRTINLTTGAKKPHHHIRLTKEFFADLEMWKLFVRDAGTLLKVYHCTQMLRESSVSVVFMEPSGSNVDGRHHSCSLLPVLV